MKNLRRRVRWFRVVGLEMFHSEREMGGFVMACRTTRPLRCGTSTGGGWLGGGGGGYLVMRCLGGGGGCRLRLVVAGPGVQVDEGPSWARLGEMWPHWRQAVL